MSSIQSTINEMAEILHKGGIIDEQTMKTFTEEAPEKTPKKSLLESIHKTSKGLYEIGLMDIKIMKEFDSICLAEKEEKKFARKKRASL
jgi:DNA-binding transcriptional regulator YiaG